MKKDSKRALASYTATSIAIILLGFAVVAQAAAQPAPIIISAQELQPNEVLSTTSFQGFDELPVFASTSSVPVHALIDAASTYPQIVENLRKEGISQASSSPTQWFKATRAFAQSVDKFDADPVKVQGIDGKFTEVPRGKLIALTKTELFGETPKIISVKYGANETPAYLFEAQAWRSIMNAYGVINAVQFEANAHFVNSQLNLSTESLKRFADLAKVSIRLLSDVTFGRPVVYSTSERGFSVPASILRDFDVYWIEFAVSFKPAISNEFEEIYFSIKLPQGSFALDLVPVRYDREVQESLKASGQVQGGAGAVVTFSAGASYERLLTFQRLIPVVLATGLREEAFTWSFLESAVVPGSHRMVAVVATPKGLKNLFLEMGAGGKTKTFLRLQNNLAVAAVQRTELKLP